MDQNFKVFPCTENLFGRNAIIMESSSIQKKFGNGWYNWLTLTSQSKHGHALDLASWLLFPCNSFNSFLPSCHHSWNIYWLNPAAIIREQNLFTPFLVRSNFGVFFNAVVQGPNSASLAILGFELTTFWRLRQRQYWILSYHRYTRSPTFHSIFWYFVVRSTTAVG